LEDRAEYPSFNSKKGDQTARYVGTAFDLREDTSNSSSGKQKLRLSKMPGLIRVRWSRELPSGPSSCTVTKNDAGQYPQVNTMSALFAPKRSRLSRESTERMATRMATFGLWA
jgi:hypothetical protein